MLIVDTSYCIKPVVSVKSQIFNAAHQEAKLSLKFAPFLTYRQAFANALRGAYAVRNGFTGEL